MSNKTKRGVRRKYDKRERARAWGISEVMHLDFLSRVTHPKSRRAVAAMAGGFGLAVVGLASVEVLKEFGIPRVVADALGGTFHAAAIAPIMYYIEPAWLIVMGVSE